MFARRIKFNETKWLGKKIAVYKDKCNSSTVIYTMIAHNSRIFVISYIFGSICKDKLVKMCMMILGYNATRLWNQV